jgi:hypothetical protein
MQFAKPTMHLVMKPTATDQLHVRGVALATHHSIVTPVPNVAERLARAKRAHTTRRADFTACRHLVRAGVQPRAGDLVLARVDALGQHKNLQDPSGRRVNLFVGDEIVVAYGNRYAPSQFEALVPSDLGPCHLAAGGGIASRVVAANARMEEPTALTPIGLLADAGGVPLRLATSALEPRSVPAACPPVIAVLGTSMDSGKTTSAAALIRGLTRLGRRVGAAKVTGTGAAADPWLFRDSGAAIVLDFLDAGYATTYLEPHTTIERITSTLIGHLADQHVDTIVIEVADGILQRETRLLMEADFSRQIFHGVMFAAADALGAAEGVRWLRGQRHNVVAATGIMTASPLARREADEVCRVPVRGVEQLEDPSFAREIEAELL